MHHLGQGDVRQSIDRCIATIYLGIRVLVLALILQDLDIKMPAAILAQTGLASQCFCLGQIKCLVSALMWSKYFIEA